MTPKQEAALRMAREALEYIYEGANNQGPHTGISWRCASNKVEPVIAAIDEALAEQPEHVAAVNTSSERVANQAQNVHMQPAQQDYWQEEARRYAQNAEFWRGKYEAATAQQQEPVAWIEHGSDEVPSVVVWERGSSGHYTPLYTSSRPSKPWVGLTAQDLIDIYNETERDDRDDVIRLTEAKLKEKNA